MILVLNNRDSFVYNLSRYFEELDEETETIGSHSINIPQIEAMAPKAIIISPGPGTPAEAGISIDVIIEFSGRVPILGVCLGHQAIAEAFGARVARANHPKYGQSSLVMHDGAGLFEGLPGQFEVGLYHSLIVTGLGGSELVECASSPEGEVMALRHAKHPTFGVQFHPESILSQYGHPLLKNFLEITDTCKC
ncbi:MAG: aminodeoxychorismate/anthranilate synthase component II [Pseudomonadota bacterium]